MKLAVFGGTGFLGYDFIKLASDSAEIELTIYSTSPKSLVNLARHELDVRLISVGRLEKVNLDKDTDFFINFSHPFGIRDEHTSREQIDLFIDFLARQKKIIPALRLLHLSSMSVYEPFNDEIFYTENSQLAPPKTDAYSSDKVYVESRIKALPGASEWQVHLRPTIVYGPFCRPWTDRILEAFLEGQVCYRDLSGIIQPVYGHDISRFIHSCLHHFIPGTYNMAGDEEVTWLEFLQFFEGIVCCGKLTRDPNSVPSEYGPSVGFFRFYKDNFKELMGIISREDSFVRMAAPIVGKLPRSLVVWVRDNVFGGEMGLPPKPRIVSLFASDFYRDNRMVSRAEFNQSFPDFQFKSLSETKQELEDYYNFRFTDIPLC
ncbi:MAG: hypothetical protein DRR42_10190 [Gammaproteobacteria bacterium]|nr:MAG: hypothetical protein DRR42_10190 [Gammaproteobacteria bacterium]